MLNYSVECYNCVHNEDGYAEHRDSGLLFVAVADGLSDSQSGQEASETVARLTKECVQSTSARPFPIDRFLDELRAKLSLYAKRRRRRTSAKTTLTAVVFEEDDVRDTVTARYVAVGDSPVYLAYPGPVMEAYPDTYLLLQMHGRPMLTENPGRVYAYIDVAAGSFYGRVSMGAFELHAQDICLVCTDGVPIWEFVVRDLNLSAHSHRFLNAVSRQSIVTATRELFDRIHEEEGFGDDATLVTVFVEPQDRNPPDLTTYFARRISGLRFPKRRQTRTVALGYRKNK